MEVRDKVVLITGGSGGIGLAAAQVFAQAGSKVALAARSGDKLAGIVEGLEAAGTDALAIQADVSQKAEVERMIDQVYQHFGRLDILINNAGQGLNGSVAVVNNDNFHQIVELNIFGPLYTMQAAAPRMREHGGGLIINISSMVSKLRIPSIGGYAATKYALNALSHTARIELAPDNIRVITVYPGQTATDFGKNALKDSDSQPRGGYSRGDSAEKVGQKILEAAQKEPRDQYMATPMRVVATMSNLVPGLIDRMIARRVAKSQASS